MIRFDHFTWAQALKDACDILVIGGSATGLGVPLQAALEGSQVALVEARDFGCGTSSRSTQLPHGGVRHLLPAPGQACSNSHGSAAPAAVLVPPTENDLQFLSGESPHALGVHLTPGDVHSIWVGLRPLVGVAQGGGGKHAPNSTLAPERPDRSRSAGFCHRDRWQMKDLPRLGPRSHGGAVAEFLREKTGIDPDLNGFLALCRQYRLQEAVA